MKANPAWALYMEWALSCPGNTDLYPQDNTTDALGNVYNAGRYRGTVDLDPSAGVLNFTANGFTDAFIQKLDAAGNLQWVANFTGGTWEQFNSVVVDPAGDLYAFGHYSGTVDFDPGPGILNLMSAGGNDLVILKLSAAGNLIWVKTIGGTGNEEGLSIGCDLSGNIYCGGIFNGSVDFDPGPGAYTLASAGGGDTYILKLDASGAFIWARSFGTVNSESLYGMDVSGAGDIIVAGTFSGSGDFNPTAGINTLSAVAFTDIYLVKLNAAGNHLWSSSIGAAGFESVSDVCFTTGGDILISGGFNGPLDFDPGPGIVSLTPSGFDGYLIKLNAAGNFLWVKQFNGNSFLPFKVEVNSSDKIFMIGSFVGTVDFDPGPGTVPVTSGNITQDAFVVGLDNTGAYEWHLDPEGAISFDQIMAFTVSSAGHLFFMGRFTTGTIDLIPGAGVMSVTNATVNSGNGFFFKMNAGSPLPVDASKLIAEIVNGFVQLTWTTFSEIDNVGFRIQRSQEGVQWEDIGFVKGKGNSHQAIEYAFVDNRRLSSTSYYRYIQIDHDGHQTPSSIAVVNPADHTLLAVPLLYPNPGNGHLYIGNMHVLSEPTEYRISDQLGRIVSEGVLWPTAAGNSLEIIGPAGTYFVSLKQNNKTYYLDYLKQ